MSQQANTKVAQRLTKSQCLVSPLSSLLAAPSCVLCEAVTCEFWPYPFYYSYVTLSQPSLLFSVSLWFGAWQPAPWFCSLAVGAPRRHFTDMKPPPGFIGFADRILFNRWWSIIVITGAHHCSSANPKNPPDILSNEWSLLSRYDGVNNLSWEIRFDLHCSFVLLILYKYLLHCSWRNYC